MTKSVAVPSEGLPAPSNTQIVVIGDMNLKLNEDELIEFKRRTLELIAATRRDDCPIKYSCVLDIEDPCHVVFVETWSSRAALDEHLQRDAFKAWFSWVEPKIDGPLTIKIAPEAEFDLF